MILDRPSKEERKIVILQCIDTAESRVSKLPRRCFLTGKQLWFRSAVRVNRDFGDSLIGSNFHKQYFWVESRAFVLLSLINCP